MDRHGVNLEPRICDLAGALTRIGGDRQLLRQLVEFFCEDAPEYLARLHAAADRGDAAGVAYSAHSLHGLVANFGADAAGLATARLEEMGQTGDLSAVADALGALKGEIARLETALVLESNNL